MGVACTFQHCQVFAELPLKSPAFQAAVTRFASLPPCCYTRHHCLSQASFGGGNPPPQKKTYNPLTVAKLCALNLFFDQESELQICHGNCLLMDNKYRKSFVIKQSNGCKSMPKMHRNRLPAGEPNALPRSPCRNGDSAL